MYPVEHLTQLVVFTVSNVVHKESHLLAVAFQVKPVEHPEQVAV